MTEPIIIIKLRISKKRQSYVQVCSRQINVCLRVIGILLGTNANSTKTESVPALSPGVHQCSGVYIGLRGDEA